MVTSGRPHDDGHALARRGEVEHVEHGVLLHGVRRAHAHGARRALVEHVPPLRRAQHQRTLVCTHHTPHIQSQLTTRHTLQYTHDTDLARRRGS